ncbi:MAG: NAD-dependent epimerase/dehydratase family protein [Bryobacteraceae bacterium]|nr:NAD-dependent epimerase/dehydratase family protein [Bryobacteraceae bacterium]
MAERPEGVRSRAPVAGGAGAERTDGLVRYDVRIPGPPALITGGAGFIGTNLAHRLMRLGRRVILLDNLSRAGVRQNLEWLRATHPGRFRMEVADVRDRAALRRCVREADFVFHFAAQVAVTSSLSNPVLDFEINAAGVLNVLEELRRLPNPPGLIFTSTNKVYGSLPDIELRNKATRCAPKDELIARAGIGEWRPLNFHSPYGCSKGAADQYVLEYARTFGIPALVFRMSCIYGPHQFGTEDQGWVAHFLIRAMTGEPITIFGDGKQVRDVLYIDDLVDAFLLGEEHARKLAGQAFNIGGGPRNTLSLLELLALARRLCGGAPRVLYENWRCGDQRYYVSDCSAFRAATGWTPEVGVEEGVGRLHQWLSESRLVEAEPALALEAG